MKNRGSIKSIKSIEPKRIKLDPDAEAAMPDEDVWIDRVLGATREARAKMIRLLGDDPLEIPRYCDVLAEMQVYMDACRAVDLGSNVVRNTKATWGIAKLLQECVFPQHGGVVVATACNPICLVQWNAELLGQLIDRHLGTELTIVDDDDEWHLSLGKSVLFTDREATMRMRHSERLVYMLATATAVPQTPHINIIQYLSIYPSAGTKLKFRSDSSPSLVGVLAVLLKGGQDGATQCFERQDGEHRRVYDAASLADILRIVSWDRIMPILNGLPKDVFTRFFMLNNTCGMVRDRYTRLPFENGEDSTWPECLAALEKKRAEMDAAWCTQRNGYFEIKTENGTNDPLAMYYAFLNCGDPFLNNIYISYGERLGAGTLTLTHDGITIETKTRFSKYDIDIRMVYGSFTWNPTPDMAETPEIRTWQTLAAKCAHVEFLKTHRKGFMTPDFWDRLILMLKMAHSPTVHH